VRVIRGRVSGSVCLLALGLLAVPARAAEIHYDAPVSCGVTLEAIEAQVERLVGRPLDEIHASEFDLRVRQVKQGWQLVLRTQDPAEKSAARGSTARQFYGASCREVTDVAAVAIALAIEGRAPTDEQRRPRETLASDADAVADPEPVTTPSTAPETDAAPGSRGAAAATPAASDENPIHLRIGLAASVLLDAGALPNWAPGGSIGMLAELGAFRVELAGALFLPQRASLGDGRGGEFDLVLGLLRACGRVSFGDMGVLGCGGFEAGMLSGHGLEVRRSRPRDTAWFALSAGAGLVWAITPTIGLQLRVELTAPLSRPDFVLDGTQSVHRAAAVGFRAGLGVEFYL
jgi:hypothetical protein